MTSAAWASLFAQVLLGRTLLLERGKDYQDRDEVIARQALAHAQCRRLKVKVAIAPDGVVLQASDKQVKWF